MSNIIPMVSASPPPMDEGGGFEWDDDDDFGTFASASDTSFANSDVTGKQDTSTHSHFKPGPPEDGKGGFADFETFSTTELKDSLNEQCTKPNDSRPESINIAQKTSEHQDTNYTNTEGDNYETVNGPLIDSGVYSSNVSPVQHSEQSGKESHLENVVDDSNTAHNKSLSDLSCNLDGNSFTKEDETKRSHTETKTDSECSVPFNGDSSVTQENECVNNDSETEIKLDSSKCIPPKDIPEDDNSHTSDDIKSDEKIVEGEREMSVDVVIPNCDDSPRHYTDEPETKSGIEDNSLSVSNDDNQESGQEYQTDDSLNAEIEQSHELNCENDSTSVSHLENQVEGSINSVNRTKEEHTESVNNNNDELGDQEYNNEENIDNCTETSENINSFPEKSAGDTNNLVNSNEPENVDLTDRVCDEETNIADGDYESSENSKHHSFDNDSENVIAEDEVEKMESEKVKKAPNDSNEIEAFSESEVQRVNKTDTESENSKCPDQERSENITEDTIEHSDAHLQSGNVPVRNNNNANSLNDKDDFGEFSATDDTKVEDSSVCEVKGDDVEDFGDFDDFSSTQVNSEESTGEFNSGVGKRKDEITSANDNVHENDIGDLDGSPDTKPESAEIADDDDDDFGDFNASFVENEDNKKLADDDFGDFNATFDSAPNVSEQTNDWAAFSEPQTVVTDDVDDEDDDWAGFEGEENVSSQFETDTPTSKTEEHEKAPTNLTNMTKHEKLLYAVMTCFPALISDMEVSDLNLAELNDLHVDSDKNVWGQVKGQQTTEALSYQWAKSLWNTQLFTTLHIDTRNILIGHKKAPVPVFAAGLTLLEPTKGQSPLKPNVLVDTTKSDSSLTSQSQIPATSVQRPNKNETIPAAQFDWSSSGLTNPLEANNKTLNLDFLIQDQATKSNALESEFLSTNDSPVHKPAIQPLESILANLKTSSTFKPTNQNEDVSKEACKVLKTLPDLVFMKAKVLMFPVKMNGSEN